jgi:pyruvate dehydrogenase E2 component (dihydrolipoamide acetyltransferase)
VEVESPFTGVVLRQLVEEKAIVPVGTPIAVIGAEGEKVEQPGAAAPAGEAAPDGPSQANEAPPAKTASESAPAAPAAKPAAEEAPTAPPPAPESPAATPPAATSAAAAPEPTGPVKASPLAKKMAQDTGVNLAALQGTGPGGRIVRKDIEAALSAGVKAPAAPAAAPVQPAAPAPAPAAAKPALGLPIPVVLAGEVPPDQRVPVDRLRAAIGRRMTESKQQLPHFYVTHEYDMAAVMEMRKQANELLPDDQKLSVNDFIVKAVALALRQFPNINASLVDAEIVRHGHVNVGIAVAMENGLLTVVTKDTDRKPLRAISQEVKEMVARARTGKVRTDDIKGSTFSISNLGMFDVEHFVAIINPPEAAILAVGSVKQVPVVVDGELRVGTRMRATISADHRVTDGAEAAQFMQRLALYLEKPLGLML